MAARIPLLAILSLLGLGVGSVGAGQPPCPGSAAIAVHARNLSADSHLELTLEGELLSADSTCTGSGSTTYATTLTCDGAGLVPCGSISGLRPGAWAHRLRVDVTGSSTQVQTQRAVLLTGQPGGAPNILAWTVFPRTFTVTAATEADLRAQLDAAAAFTAANPGPALVTFARAAFAGAASPRVILLSQRSCDPGNVLCAAIRLTASRIVVDALDSRGAIGAVVLSVGTQKNSLLRVLGSDNVFRGLSLLGSLTDSACPTCQYDTVALSGPGATGNRLEQSVVRGPSAGDTVGIDDGAGTPAGDGSGVTVIDRCELSGAHDKGLKVTTGAHVLIQNSCVHDNLNGGIQSTLGGRIVAVDNLVQHNVAREAQNGISAGGDPDARSLLATDGNIIRFAGARGLSVANNAEGDFRNDYVSDNQFSGARVETTQPGPAPRASFHGVALVCNHNAGVTGVCQPRVGNEDVNCLADAECAPPAVCVPNATVNGVGAVQGIDCVGDCLLPMVEYGTAAVPGANAFALNASLAAGTTGTNLNQAVPGVTVDAQGNQWEHCGPAATCDTTVVAAADIRVATGGAVVLGGPSPGPRAGVPSPAAVSPGRPSAGELVRVLGAGFDAVDGAACATGSAPVEACGAGNPALAERNRCDGAGNCLQLTVAGQTVPLDVAAVTPTMLAFRMPFDCFAPATLQVSRPGADGGRVAGSITLCDPSGCLDQPAGAPCDDGNACTLDDRCRADGFACAPGAARPCTGPCFTGTCDPQRGCVPSAATAACDDVNRCTVGDHCSGTGDVCVPGTPLHCAGACLTGTCDPQQGCVAIPATAACDDGNACTVGDHCRGDGDVCVPGTPRACSGPCLSGVCDPTRGCLPAPATTGCDDGDTCTLDDHCGGDGDACVAGTVRACAGPCFTGRCDPRRGCVPSPAVAPCDDGDPCTVADRCSGDGACRPGMARSCDDGDPCTDDRCDSDGGCLHQPRVGYDAITCRLTSLQQEVTGTTGPRPKLDRLLARIREHTETARTADGQGDRRRARRYLGRAERAAQQILALLPHLGLSAEHRRTLRALARAVRVAIHAERATLVEGRTRTSGAGLIVLTIPVC